MDLRLAKALTECCNDAGIRANYRERYYGRGMHNTYTAAVVVEGGLPLLLTAAIESAHLLVDVDLSSLYSPGSLKTDDMGKTGTVVY